MRDEALILQVQLKATGASIHRVNQLLCAYSSYAHIVEQEPDDAEAKSTLEETERLLRIFVATGQLPRN